MRYPACKQLENFSIKRKKYGLEIHQLRILVTSHHTTVYNFLLCVAEGLLSFKERYASSLVVNPYLMGYHYLTFVNESFRELSSVYGNWKLMKSILPNWQFRAVDACTCAFCIFP
jgi:hypothetical protein